MLLATALVDTAAWSRFALVTNKIVTHELTRDLRWRIGQLRSSRPSRLQLQASSIEQIGYFSTQPANRSIIPTESVLLPSIVYCLLSTS